MRWLITLALLATACAAKPACPIAKPAAHGPAFLWKAQRGGDVVWLYGTIHMAGLDSVPAAVLDALATSARLVTELGDVEPDREVFLKYARIASGPGIDQQLPASDWYDLRDALRGRIKEADLARAKPWYAMSLLTTYLAPDPGPSMDVQLAKRARELGKPVEPLESWADQLAVLDGSVTVEDLQETIHARGTMTCDLARMRAAYVAGDLAAMEALLLLPRTVELVLTPRNRKWLPVIEEHFMRGGAFVAVGLGHMLGEDGLVAMLQRAGYTVERTTAR